MTDVKRRTAARKFAHLKDLKLIESSAEKTSNYIPVFEGNPDFFMHLYHVLIKY
jgi:hypothetical protein